MVLQCTSPREVPNKGRKRVRAWCVDATSRRRTNYFFRQQKLGESLFDQVKDSAFATLVEHRKKENLTDQSLESTQAQQRVNRKPERKKRKTPLYSGHSLVRQLVIPDFLVDIPSNLSIEWLAYKRPEGTRVVIASCYGMAYVFNKVGKLLGSFPAAFPHEGCTVLDAVVCCDPGFGQPLQLEPQEWASNVLELMRSNEKKNSPTQPSSLQSNTLSCVPHDAFFVVVDGMSWGDCSLVELPFECRRFLLQSKFECLDLATVSTSNSHPFYLIPIVDAAVQNLDDLYWSRNNVLRNVRSDSIVFVHKEALYVPGLSQLYLCWRDEHLSRYYVDTVDGVNISPKQIANVWLRLEDGGIFTEDTIRIAVMSKDRVGETLNSLKDTVYLRQWRQGTLRKKILIRIEFSHLNLATLAVKRFETHEGPPKLCFDGQNEKHLIDDFKIIDTASPKRRTAESLNRILHQFLMRQRHSQSKSFNRSLLSLSFDDIRQSAKLGIPNYTMMVLQGNRHLEDFYEPSEKSDTDAMSDQDYDFH